MAIVLIAILLISYISVRLKISTDENKVWEYLLKERGYKKSDITNVDGHFGKLPLFSVSVTYSDEPQIKYYYKIENSRVVFLNHSLSRNSNYEFKHEK